MRWKATGKCHRWWGDKLMGLSVAQTSWPSNKALGLWHWRLRSWIKGSRFEFPMVEQGQVSLQLLLQKMCGQWNNALFKSYCRGTSNSTLHNSSTIFTCRSVAYEKKKKWKHQILHCTVVDHLLRLMWDFITICINTIWIESKRERCQWLTQLK